MLSNHLNLLLVTSPSPLPALGELPRILVAGWLTR
jgi:hypothetical protein